MDKGKLASAQKALEFVKPEMSLGLGTGSTAEIFIDLLGKKNKEENMGLMCIATSIASERQARGLGLEIGGFAEIDGIDAAFDGADQVDSEFNLIKGLGGALVREKIVDYRAKKFYVLVGENKIVGKLSGIVPVEVIPMAEEAVRRELLGMGATEAATRLESGKKKFITDNGNIIIHAKFGEIGSPETLERQMMMVPGIVDNGIFTSKNTVVIVGREDGTAKVLG